MARRSKVAASAAPTEIEVKLALPGADVQAIAAAVAASPVLARRKAQRQRVFSQYFDTPDQALRRQRVALRLRRLGSPEQPQWRQTLKTAGQGDSAFSVRGEWEMPVPGPALALELLQNSPWPQMDADSSLSAALQPCFTTEFERTIWLVRQRDGSQIEVALDIGSITAAGRSVPLCELELELIAGSPAALLDLAGRIARSVAVLPLAASKAERGFALQASAHSAANPADPVLAVLAQPPKVSPSDSLARIARQVLGEAFLQFTANLYRLQTNDAPELVHQARVGWRRFRSLWRMLRPLLPDWALPPLQALQPLLGSLGALRDLDVARTETLPPLAQAYLQHSQHEAGADMPQQWQQLQTALGQAASQERAAVRAALMQPSVGAALLALSHWLELLDGPLAATVAPQSAKAQARSLQALRRRALRLAKRLEQMLHQCQHDHSPEGIERQHEVRILAKRLRYNVHALAPLLPKRLQQQHRAAQQLQERLGAARDLLQARHLVARWGANPLWLAFLQGVVVARTLDEPPSP